MLQTAYGLTITSELPLPKAATRGIYWLASYPKSGNTWFRAVLANYQRGEVEPVNINALHTGGIASARGMMDELLGLETSDLAPDEIDRLRPLAHDWRDKPGEIIYQKTHDAYRINSDGTQLLGSRQTRGALYFIRNPLDIAISYAHHNGTGIDKAIESMGRENHGLNRSKKSIYRQVRQHMGTWSQHVLSWVDAPALNLLVLRYEDMHADGWHQFGLAITHLGLSLDEERRLLHLIPDCVPCLMVQRAALDAAPPQDGQTIQFAVASCTGHRRLHTVTLRFLSAWHQP